MITIDTKPTGETTLFIAAESIMAAIHRLDRARAALAALDDSNEPEPVSAEELAAPEGLPIALAQRQSAGNPLGQAEAVAPVKPIIETAPTALPVAQETPAPPQTVPVNIPLEDAADEPPPTAEELRAEIIIVGLRLFGEAWKDAHTWLIKLWTSHYTPANIRSAVTYLDSAECMAILDGMINRAQETLAHWRKHLAEQETKAAAAARPAPRGRQPRPAASFTAPRRAAAPQTPAQVAATNDPVYATG